MLVQWEIAPHAEQEPSKEYPQCRAYDPALSARYPVLVTRWAWLVFIIKKFMWFIKNQKRQLVNLTLNKDQSVILGTGKMQLLLLCLILGFTANCIFEIHCLALDGFDVNTAYKPSSKDKKSWQSRVLNPGLLVWKLECFLCATQPPWRNKNKNSFTN